MSLSDAYRYLLEVREKKPKGGWQQFGEAAGSSFKSEFERKQKEEKEAKKEKEKRIYETTLKLLGGKEYEFAPGEDLSGYSKPVQDAIADIQQIMKSFKKTEKPVSPYYSLAVEKFAYQQKKDTLRNSLRKGIAQDRELGRALQIYSASIKQYDKTLKDIDLEQANSALNNAVEKYNRLYPDNPINIFEMQTFITEEPDLLLGLIPFGKKEVRKEEIVVKKRKQAESAW